MLQHYYFYYDFSYFMISTFITIITFYIMNPQQACIARLNNSPRSSFFEFCFRYSKRGIGRRIL